MKRKYKITALLFGVLLLTSCSFIDRVRDYMSSERPTTTTSSVPHEDRKPIKGETFCEGAINVPANYADTKISSAFLNSPVADLYKEARRSTVTVNACYTVGGQKYNYITSGFVYAADEKTNNYYVATNASGIFHRYYSNDGASSDHVHVVRSGDYEIGFEDGRRYYGDLVGSFDNGDLAVFSVETSDDIPVAPIGDSDLLAVGDGVIAIGTPSLGETLMNSVVRGTVSGLHRREFVYFDTTVNYMARSFDVANYEAFQFDAPLNGGMEGGPIYNTSGEIIGMASYKYRNDVSSVNYESISMAIPINNLINPLDKLIREGEYTRPMIGVTVSDVDQFSLPQLEENNVAPGLYTGCYIVEVSPNTAAGRAGMRKGEVIISIGGVEVENMAILSGQLQRRNRGDSVVIRTKNASGVEKSYNLTF